MSTQVDPVLAARGRLAYASRQDIRTNTAKKVVEARRDLKSAVLERHIREVVTAEPKLTEQQLDRLAALLRPAFRAGASA